MTCEEDAFARIALKDETRIEGSTYTKRVNEPMMRVHSSESYINTLLHVQECNGQYAKFSETLNYVHVTWVDRLGL